MILQIPDIIGEVNTGVVLVGFYIDSRKVGSGSAFVSKGKIISNNHVFHPPEGDFPLETVVKLRGSGTEFSFQYSDLATYVVCGSSIDNSDYIVLDIGDANFFDGKFQFELRSHVDVKIGEQILIMGYPFEHENLASHIGHVSAKHLEVDVNILQLDASVNNGNSGGPLIDLKTKKVVGIVTRKATGLAKQFDELIKSFDQNIEIFDKASQSIITFDGINYKEAFKETQNQMKMIAVNLKRSSNVGIGYAFACDRLMSENFYTT